MSLFFRDAPPTSKRSISYQDVWGSGRDFNTGTTESGESINADSAMRVAALWSSADLIASIVSTMPVGTFAGSTSAPVNPSPSLVASPSLVVTRREWTYQAIMSLLLRGNAYGLIVERDNNLRPQAAEWLDPSAVTVTQSSSTARPTYSINGQPIPRDDMIHMRGFLRPGSAIGLSLIDYHRETLGISTAALKHGGKWYGSGAHPTAMLFNTEKTITAEQATTVKARFMESLRGKREPIVLGKDWKYEQIQASAADSLFLDAMGYTDAQIARLFGPAVAEVLGYETGGSMTYSNREQRTLDLLAFSIQKWLVRLEDTITAMLPQPQYIKYNASSLLRADTLTRYQAHEIALQNRFETTDEVRALEDLPPMEQQSAQRWQEVGLPALISAGIIAPKWAAEQVGAPSEGLPDKPTPPVLVAPAATRQHRSMTEAELRALVTQQSSNHDGLIVNVTVDPPEVPVTVNVEPTPVTIDVQPAATTLIERSGEAPIVNVTVDPTPITVDVQPAPVMVAAPTINVQPADVTILPTEPRRRVIERDRKGEIVAVHEES